MSGLTDDFCNPSQLVYLEKISTRHTLAVSVYVIGTMGDEVVLCRHYYKSQRIEKMLWELMDGRMYIKYFTL